jgi:hypothetical protein
MTQAAVDWFALAGGVTIGLVAAVLTLPPQHRRAVLATFLSPDQWLRPWEW